MKRSDNTGFTLVELLIVVAIMAIIASAAFTMLSAGLDAQVRYDGRFDLYQEGMRVMERLTDSVRRCTFLEIPNAHQSVRNILAVSGFDNDDDDYYFNNPLFPRIDEDPHENMNQDSENGIAGVDDDGDGQVDEATPSGLDDDEDGAGNEDPVDGLDNDGDGNVDEDVPTDANNDGGSGIAGIDDNGDGVVDNGIDNNDDDEDGASNEDTLNEVIFWIPSGTTLREDHHISSQDRTLSDRVTFFQVTRETPQRLLIELTLTGESGETVQFSEYVCARNMLQNTGKRVR